MKYDVLPSFRFAWNHDQDRRTFVPPQRPIRQHPATRGLGINVLVADGSAENYGSNEPTNDRVKGKISNYRPTLYM